MKINRHKARELMVQALFTWEFREGKLTLENALSYVLTDVESGIENPEDAFLQALFRGIETNIDRIKALIEQYAPEWPLPKINPIDRAILYIALFEMLYSPEVPDVVAINEAIELAKKFGNKSSPKFVNGVLNSVLQKEVTPDTAS